MCQIGTVYEIVNLAEREIFGTSLVVFLSHGTEQSPARDGLKQGLATRPPSLPPRLVILPPLKVSQVDELTNGRTDERNAETTQLAS